MSKHWEKQIAGARAVVASVGQPPERSEPRSQAEVESFVKGFNLSAAATRMIVAEWMADQNRGYQAGWESRADAEWHGQG